MKKISVISFLLIVVFLSSVLTGCSCNNNGNADVTDDPSAMNTDAAHTLAPGETAAPTDDLSTSSPEQSGDPALTAAPGTTDAPVLPTGLGPIDPTTENTPAPTNPPEDHPITAMTWISANSAVTCDMDLDGKPEKIEIVSSGDSTVTVTVNITVGSSGNKLNESVSADRFVSALLNNFNPSDNRFELIVSACTGNRDHKMLILRLNSSSSSLEQAVVDGWAEAVEGDSLIVGRLYDVMGTWECTAPFKFKSGSLAVEQDSEMWDVVRSSERWCTVSTEMLVCFYTTGRDNEVGFLLEGYRLYPTSTDMSTKVNVTLDTGAPGYFDVTVDPSGRLLLHETDMTEWFSDLYFIN